MFVKNLNRAIGTKVGLVKIDTFTFECLVLENNDCALTLATIQKSFGYTGNSSLWFHAILENLGQKVNIPFEILEVYKSPLKTQITTSNNEIRLIEIVTLSLFISTCELLLVTDLGGNSFGSEKGLSETSKKILNAITIVNLTELIEEATGHSLNKEHAIFKLDAYYMKHTNDTAFKWIKTIPKSFWIILFEIHDLNWVSIKENPSTIGRILFDIIFCRLSDSLMDSIRSEAPKRAYKRKGSQPQQNEHTEIKEYIISILTLLKVTNNNWPVFLQLLNRTHPVNPNYKTKLPIFTPTDSIEKPTLSHFNKILLGTS